MSRLGFRGGSAGQKKQKLLPDVSQLYSLTVCLSACLSVCTHVSRLTTRSNFTEILADVTYGRSQFLFWQRWDTSRTSGLASIVEQVKATQVGRKYSVTHQGKHRTGAESDVYHCLFTPPPVGMVEYCDEHVCMSVCLRDEHISGSTHPIFTNFLCMLTGAVAVLL